MAAINTFSEQMPTFLTLGKLIWNKKFFSLHPSARCTRVFSSVTLSTCCITATCLQQQLLLFIFSQNCKNGKKLYNVSTEIKGTRCIKNACYIRINVVILIHIKSKSSLYSPYYAKVCNELRDPSPRLSAWATQLRKSVATVASRASIWLVRESNPRPPTLSNWANFFIEINEFLRTYAMTRHYNVLIVCYCGCSQ